MYDVRTTIIAWTPMWVDANNPTRGRVRLFPVGAHIPAEWAATAGGCLARVRVYRGIGMQHYLLSEAWGMVHRDGVDPEEVHRAFSAFQEWREAIPEDIPVAPEAA